MATKAAANKTNLFREYDEFSKALQSDFLTTSFLPTANVGLLGSFPTLEQREKAEKEAIEAKLAAVKATGFYRRVTADTNYADALRGITIRGKQTKRIAYLSPLSEMALLRAFAMYLHFYELLDGYPIEESFPTKDELRTMRVQMERATVLLKRFSGIGTKIASYPLTENMASTIARIKHIERSYRKTRVDADTRKKKYAEEVAVQLHREFGECAPVVFAPVCALVRYNVAASDLRALARKAIGEDSELRKFDAPLPPLVAKSPQ